MLSKTKKLILAGVSMTMGLSLTAGVYFTSQNKTEVFKGNADDVSHSIVFNKACGINSMTIGGKPAEYTYSTSDAGTKYGLVMSDCIGDHDSYDLISFKGSSDKYINITFGNINNDGSYTQASFKKGVKSISIECCYTYTWEQSFYLRVYHSGDNSTYAYKSYKPTKDSYSVLTYDLSTLVENYENNTNYIRFTMTNANVTVHIKSITLNYDC